MASARKILSDVLEGAEPREQRPRGPENRTTVMLRARVRPEVKERAERDAGGYGLTLSEYVSNLITGQEPAPPVAGDGISEGLLHHLAGNRVMHALAEVDRRISADEDLAGIRAELQQIRRAIVAGQLAIRPQYEAAIAGRKHPEHEWGDA